LCLDAANSKSYPGSGASWIDLAGGYSCTLQNTPTFDSAGFFTFNGSTHYMSTNLGLDENSDYTFSWWVKSSTTTENRGLMSMGSGPSVGGFHFNYSANNPLWYLAGSNYRYWVDPSAQDDGNWHYWVLRHKGTAAVGDEALNSTLYIDNVLISATSTAHTSTISPWGSLVIGRDTGPNYWAGSIATFTIHNGNIPLDESTQNYNALKGRFGL